DQDQMKMMWFWFCWVLGPVVLASPSLFSLHPSPAIFSVAEAACPSGRLASLSSDQEVSAVLNLVSGSNGSVFWIGLRKVKDACVDPGLPLRGFSWTGGGSRAPQVIRWAQEPQETCTTLRCAAIRLNQTGTSGTSWGLIPVSCRSKNPYICKGRGTWITGTRSLREDNRTRSAACQLCEPGFIRTGSGDCEDIDECSGGPGPAGLPASTHQGPTGQRCFCIDDAGESHAEDLPVCAPTLGLLFPLLVAMAVLVVLVVVVAVTVALCMRRKRAMKNKEGYEPANEKEASGGSEL
ncbi:hypothetical protein KUCAC02_034947, partial [Chaenocephalus aceratus]